MSYITKTIDGHTVSVVGPNPEAIMQKFAANIIEMTLRVEIQTTFKDGEKVTEDGDSVWKADGVQPTCQSGSSEANARLTVAAPDLLAAAKSALDVFVNQGWEHDLLAAKKLSAAIQKAEGK